MKAFWRSLLALLVLTATVHADQVVAEAQRKLKQAGYYQGQIDGQMGSQTAAAIRRYQLAQDIRVNGQLTPETVKHLGLKPAPAPVPEYVAIADIFKGGPYIEAGPERQIAAIRQAQKNLKLLGYYGGPVNGSPSPALVASLKAWQKSAGFRQTGRFDESTLKGLDIIKW